jgi:hypothetical protein
MVEGTNGANRISLYIGIAASGAVLLVTLGGFFYVAFQTSSNAAKIEAQQKLIDAIQDTVSLNRGRLSAQEMALKEIETQFCSEDIVRNLMHANDMRIESMLWTRSFGAALPTDNAYYPIICNRKPD